MFLMLFEGIGRRMKSSKNKHYVYRNASMNSANSMYELAHNNNLIMNQPISWACELMHVRAKQQQRTRSKSLIVHPTHKPSTNKEPTHQQKHYVVLFILAEMQLKRNQPISQSTDQASNKSTNQPNNQFTATKPSTKRQINGPAKHKSISRPTKYPMNQPTNQQAN